MGKRKGKQRKAIGFYKDRKGKTRPITVPLSQIRRIHEKRSEHAQRIDESLKADVPVDRRRWMRQPNRLDVMGVDYFPTPFMKGSAKRDSFNVNVKMLAQSIDDYYGSNTLDLKSHGIYDVKEWENLRPSKNFYAFASGNDIYFSPKATFLIANGEINDSSDFFALSSISHEIGHVIGDTRPLTSTQFNEGVNELLSNRFTILSAQMPRKLRKELVEIPHTSYSREVAHVSDIALLVNDGDRQKALDWMKKLWLKRTPDKEKRRMVEVANKKLIKMGVTKVDESKNVKEIDRLEKRLTKLNSEVVKLDGKVHPLFMKLGTTSDKRGVISWVDGYPKKELLEKYPEKKADAEKYTKLFRKLESKRKEMHTIEKRKNDLRDELDKSVFQGKITPSKVDTVRTKHLFQRHPEVVGYSNNWWMNVECLIGTLLVLGRTGGQVSVTLLLVQCPVGVAKSPRSLLTRTFPVVLRGSCVKRVTMLSTSPVSSGVESVTGRSETMLKRRT
jgi:hypothetical protein